MVGTVGAGGWAAWMGLWADCAWPCAMAGVVICAAKAACAGVTTPACWFWC